MTATRDQDDRPPSAGDVPLAGDQPASTTRTVFARAGWAFLVVLGGAAATLLGLLIPRVGIVPTLTVVVGVVGIIVLGAFALHRFEWFVWTVLLVRPILDLAKNDAGGSSGPLATLVGGAVIVIGAVWLAALSRSGRRLPLGTSTRALLLLMLTSIPSVVGSDEPGQSALQLARTLGAVVLFLVLEQMLRSREAATKTLAICGLSAVVPLAAGLAQLATGTGIQDPDGLTRITGTFVHPNSLGFFLVVILLVGYCVRAHVVRRVRWCIDIALVVALLELIFTYSRGSWLVLLVGLLVVALLADRKLLIVLPVVMFVLYAFIPQIRERLTDLTQGETVGGRPANSATWRLAHTQQILSDVHGQALFGIGPGMADTLTTGGRAPHNDFVRIFVENGLIGFACYVGFVIGLVVLAFRAVRQLRDGFGRGLAVGFVAVVAAFVVDSVGANLITQFLLLIYVFSLAAVVQAWLRYPPVTHPPDTAEGTGKSVVENSVPERSLHGRS